MSTYSLFAAALAGVTLLSGCSSPCKHFAFSEFSPGVFVGCRPRAQADFAALQHCGIRTILSFESFTWHIGPERRKAAQNHLAFQNVAIFASPLGPSEKSVKKALLALNDQSLRPVYVHCLYGRDRTAMILALHRVYYEGWSPQAAWDEMIRRGFNNDWSLWGFKHYFWRHTQIPAWVRANPLPDRAELPP